MSKDETAGGVRVISFTPGSRSSSEALTRETVLPVIALFVCAPALAVLSWLWVNTENFEQPISGVFLAIEGVLLLTLAFLTASLVRRTLRIVVRRGRSGMARFVPAGGATVGRGLRGEVHLPWTLKPDESAVITLTCTVKSPGLDGWVVSHRLQSDATIDAAACPPAAEARVPIAMEIPSNAPASGVYKVEGPSERHVEWDLSVAIEPNGPRLISFAIPVAPGPMPLLHMTEQDSADMSGPEPARPACSRIVVKTDPRGVEFRLPRQMAFASLVLWIVLTAPAWIVLPWLAWRDWRDWPGNLIAMLIIAVLINGVPLLVLMEPRRLQVGPGGVVIRRLLRRGARSHVRAVRRAVVKSWMTVTPLPAGVWLEHEPGKKQPVYRCASSAEARWFAAEINRALAEARARRSEGTNQGLER